MPKAPLPNWFWVDTQDRFEQCLDEIISTGSYAFDTEFHRERSYYADLALIQLKWQDKIALCDPYKLDLGSLEKLFESDALAVGHACEQDLQIFYKVCGKIPSNLFDTQLAAGFVGMSSPSLAKLTEAFLEISISKQSRLSDWTIRPLSNQQQAYAALDVMYLINLYALLDAKLNKLGRSTWLKQELDNLLSRSSKTIDVKKAWWKLKDSKTLEGKSRGVAQQVAAWREILAQEKNIPSRFIISDLAISSIAHSLVLSKDDLYQVRGMDLNKLNASSIESLLQALQEGINLQEKDLVLPPFNEYIDSKLKPALALVSAWISQFCQDIDLDPSLLATRKDLELFFNGKQNRLDLGWRKELIGQSIQELLRGNLVVALEQGYRLVLEKRN